MGTFALGAVSRHAWLIEFQKLGCNFEPNYDNTSPKTEVMKKSALIVTFCLSAVAPLLADGTNVLTDDKSRLSYAIGMMTGHQWKLQGLDFDPDLYARGIKDAMAGGTMLHAGAGTTNHCPLPEGFRRQATAKADRTDG
jgi:hypothetical protein